MMKKLLIAAAAVLALGTGAASANTLYGQYQQAPQARVAAWRANNAFGLGTTSAESRNVGPLSTAAGIEVSPYGSANSGMPSSPRAPAGGNVTGGN